MAFLKVRKQATRLAAEPPVYAELTLRGASHTDLFENHGDHLGGDDSFTFVAVIGLQADVLVEL
jgi:hypothetical protein